MFKNVASQKLIVFAFDSTTNLPKTGDSANLTAYVSKDFGSVTVLGDTSATEMDATNAKGYYLFDLTQGETNADTLLFSAKSSTSNIVVIAVPATVFTLPPNFTARSIDSSGNGKATLADSVTHGGSAAVLTLKTVTVSPGSGNGDAVTITGGAASGATPAGNGLTITGGAASTSSGGTSGKGLAITGGAGAASTNGAASAILFTAGGTTTVSGADAVAAAGSGAGAGIKATGGSTGHGLSLVGGSLSGSGLSTVASLSGHGITALGVGGGSGFSLTGGTSGHGMSLVGGSGGNGLNVSSSNGHGINAMGGSSGKHGINAQGGVAVTTSPAGHGIFCQGGTASTSSGGTAGSGFKITGGSGAASTNGAGPGFDAAGGGTTTVSGNSGLKIAATGSAAGLSLDTLTASGAVTFSSTFTVTGDFTATSSGNDIRGIQAKDATAAFLAKFFSVDSGTTYASAVAGSVVKETSDGDLIADKGTAQAGASTTITLRAGASATDDYYKDATVVITGGTGVGQVRQITGYVGSTKVATVDTAWATNPDNTSTYKVLGRII